MSDSDSTKDESELTAEPMSSVAPPEPDTVTTEHRTVTTEVITPAPVPSDPPQIIIQNDGMALSRLIGWTMAWVGWICVLVCIGLILYLWSGQTDYLDTTGGITESFCQGDSTANDKIAVLQISGVIYDGDGFVKQQIERIRKDKSVRAVVIRVDSPGGTVAGSDYMFHHLKKLREERDLPMVVSMGSIAASGGYYVSMAAGGTIFAEPTTTTGSIGVIIPHYDISKFLAKYDITNDSIASGDHKQMLSMTKPISGASREKLKDHVMELFEMFKDRIKEGRPYFKDHPEDLNAIATGEIVTATKAKEHKLIDTIGFIEDAIARAAHLAGLEDEKVRVIKYNRPESLLDLDLGLASAGSRRAELDLLFELSTPKAYFLATSLPPLVASRRAD